jgi:hypothetical protein
VLALAVPADGEDDEAAAEGGGAVAAFVLHSAELGPIAVRLRLAGGGVSVQVGVEPAAEELARTAAHELRESVERATGARTSVAVSARAPEEPRPVVPPLGSSLDAYA